jgi:hypothetical protein
MATLATRRTACRLVRAGAVFFGLWGVLHLLAALTGVLGYVQGGPIGVLSAYGGATAPAQPGHILSLAGGIGLNYSIDLAAFAVLAIWVAVMLWRGQRLGFWLGAVVLGAADAAFVLALVLPGYVPVADSFVGPLLYVLGVAFTAAGLFGSRAIGGVVPMARAGEVHP